jgi:hypothetical protein
MKFNQVKTDEDTVITSQVECMFGDYPVLYQKWVYDGIDAESLIFCNEDVAIIPLNDLVEDIRKSPLVNYPEKEITTSINELYTFVNFNFKVN